MRKRRTPGEWGTMHGLEGGCSRGLLEGDGRGEERRGEERRGEERRKACHWSWSTGYCRQGWGTGTFEQR
tara:strand:+ start:6039 stop:6248 length:210 start_codon:yes stop_codon:yes gene_type:complete